MSENKESPAAPQSVEDQDVECFLAEEIKDNYGKVTGWKRIDLPLTAKGKIPETYKSMRAALNKVNETSSVHNDKTYIMITYKRHIDVKQQPGKWLAD